MIKLELVEKPWSGVRYSAPRGRSRILTNCPFCERPLIVYVWSINGCGKKNCPCGAVLRRGGMAEKHERVPEVTK